LVLFNAFSVLDNYSAFLLLELIVIGSAVGLEIPLVIRILQDYRVLKLNVSNVLTVDYLGALFASLLFPLVLVPQLGLIRTSVLFGLLNTFVAAIAIWTFRAELARRKTYVVAVVVCAGILGGIFFRADGILGFFESRLFAGEIIHASTSPYQRIVVARNGQTINLFINGALQFSSIDEHRYHESLVHPVMSLSRRHDHVLILGGGDGLALREVLKYDDVRQATLVDLDPAITNLFRDNALMRGINAGSLTDSRTRIVNEDAWRFLEETTDRFDVVIIDLPDPHNLSLSKLYSKSFYTLLTQRLNADSLFVTQATSPVFATRAYWSIVATLRAVPSPLHRDERLQVRPYHTYVPSFGEWGFVMAGARLPTWDAIDVIVSTRYLDRGALRSMTHFARDVAEIETEVNTIHTHVLPRYYDAGWNRWYE
jgi:spermidine synthase